MYEYYFIYFLLKIKILMTFVCMYESIGDLDLRFSEPSVFLDCYLPGNSQENEMGIR